MDANTWRTRVKRREKDFEELIARPYGNNRFGYNRVKIMKDIDRYFKGPENDGWLTGCLWLCWLKVEEKKSKNNGLKAGLKAGHYIVVLSCGLRVLD